MSKRKPVTLVREAQAYADEVVKRTPPADVGSLATLELALAYMSGALAERERQAKKEGALL